MDESTHSDGPAIEVARDRLHAELAEFILVSRGSRTVAGREVPVLNNADSHNDLSVFLAAGMAELMPLPAGPVGGGSTTGAAFEAAIRRFIASGLDALKHLTPWELEVEPGRLISDFMQFSHLDEVQRAIKANPELEAVIGGDYLVRPDIVVFRQPLTDEALNGLGSVVGGETSIATPARLSNSDIARPLLHASVSCKWSIRSDRVQNTRTEALNLVRNRKGRTPHIVAVTAEPLPSRLAAIAIGTGDIDCVYHVALPELERAADFATEVLGRGGAASQRRLASMVASSRLRDISDLPIDLLG